MSDIAIQVEGIGKRYRIGRREKNQTFREAIMAAARAPFQRLRNPVNTGGDEAFWALKDVSFSVKRGEVVGVIGRNGAGKSTLLKILSRITEPTEGQAVINGRVGSLLEVGTGFHPELTGRENVYLNGAILGMKRGEIDKKFDEIVAFSEIEKFLDTPVKHYSSGMYMRLAFAVAAHLDPEILIVDEVLAVGDAEFQKKCLGKMQHVAGQGRTVLFVSHNMAAISSLCSRTIVLRGGGVIADASAVDGVTAYLKSTVQLNQQVGLQQRTDRRGSGTIRIKALRILDRDSHPGTALVSGGDYRFEITFTNRSQCPVPRVTISLDIWDERGVRLLLYRSDFTGNYFEAAPGDNTVVCRLDRLPLTLGDYRISLCVVQDPIEMFDYIEDAALFTVGGGDFFGTGKTGLPSHCRILQPAAWSPAGSASLF